MLGSACGDLAAIAAIAITLLDHCFGMRGRVSAAGISGELLEMRCDRRNAAPIAAISQKPWSDARTRIGTVIEGAREHPRRRLRL